MLLIDSIRLRIRQIRRKITVALISFPKIVQCNLCNWGGKRLLSDRWHPYTVCPQCGSEVRHRLLAAALSELDGLSYQDIIQNKRILHFAAEKSLTKIIQKFAATYVTADYLREGFDLTLDLSDMISIRDSEFDVIIACDVLEHIPNDMKAMKEIYRVLSAGGYAVLAVPQKDNLKETFEDPNIITPEDRTKAFGQWDHLRIYGDDFIEKLESVGFEVAAIDETNFSEKMIKKNVLFPPILSQNPLAANHRKIFFARKNA